MKKERILKFKLIAGSSIVLALTPIAIVGCSKNNSNNENNDLVENINEEVARVNSLSLTLENDLLSNQDIEAFISSPISFLNEKVIGWSENKNFSYVPKLINDQNKKQLKLTIEIVNNKNTNEKLTSKEFIFQYRNKSNLLNEVDCVNSSDIKLFKSNFEEIELAYINERVFKSFLIGLNSNDKKFIYDISDLKRENSSYKFRIKVTSKEDQTEFEYSKEFVTNFSLNAVASSPSTNIGEEIERINKIFSFSLIKSDITEDELKEINKLNILSKITNISNIFDTNKFDYKVHTLAKYVSPTNDILINFKVYEKGQPEPPIEWIDRNFTNTFTANFNIVQSKKEEEKIDNDYLKNNLIDPISDGRHFFSRPGGGQGTSSIVLESGKRDTTPSPGVPPSGLISKGIIYNEVEKRQLKNTFSLAFVDHSGGVTLGTGWILDYKLTDDGSYPTTWYIATNAHVIQNLKVPNDIISPERYEETYKEDNRSNNTNFVQLRTVRNPQIGKEIPTLSAYENYWYVSAEVPAVNLKTIFIGNDYLKTSPSDFTTSSKWQGTEEYADFAVMEVKFRDEAEAKKMTQNYVGETDRHFKYKKESLLKGSVQKDYYSVVGFPNKNKDAIPREVDVYTSRGATKDNKPTNEDKEWLTNLATSPYYNTFNGKQGMFDGAIGFSFFGMNYRQAFQFNQWYNSWGLIYPVDYGNLGPGSSGSMLMDKEGYTVGIHFAIDPEATMGFSQALYCEGFNYQGKFGSYNLEGYDLIEGGFPNQRTSYKENLRKLYGSNFRTKLFSNGLN